MAEELTVCTVSFKNKALVELNRQLTAALNPAASPQWIVVENSPPSTGNAFSVQGGEFTVIEGVPFNPSVSRAASHHHAQALHKALAQLNTRFVLILDPDFYIVLPDWVHQIPQYMQQKGLAVLGVPWHPRWFAKFREYPTMHCMFIDLAQFERDDLDFSPGSYVRHKKKPRGEDEDSESVSLARRIFRKIVTSSDLRERLYNLFVAPLNSVRKAIIVNLLGRHMVNRTPDTGYTFYQRTQPKSINFEFIPVVFYDHEYPVRPRLINRLIDRVVPEKFRFVSMQEGYLVRSGFKAAGLTDTTQYACEEFMWQGKPFGFHVRSVPRTIKQNPLSIEQLTEIVEGITSSLELQ
jgi:hypothetical protein